MPQLWLITVAACKIGYFIVPGKDKLLGDYVTQTGRVELQVYIQHLLLLQPSTAKEFGTCWQSPGLCVPEEGKGINYFTKLFLNSFSLTVDRLQPLGQGSDFADNVMQRLVHLKHACLWGQLQVLKSLILV